MDSTYEVLLNAKRLSNLAYLVEPSELSTQIPISPGAYSSSPERKEAQRPAFQRHNSLPPSPRTIILSAWPTASLTQFTHYISGYRTLFPRSQILLLTFTPTSVFLPASALSEQLLPAIEVIAPESRTPSFSPSADAADASLRTDYFHVSAGNKSQYGSVLLHVFGIPSATRACAFLRLYRAHYGSPLPLRAIVSDAEPARSLCPQELIKDVALLRRRALGSTFLAGGTVLMAYLLDALISFAVALAMLLGSVMGFANDDEQVRRELNDPVFVPGNVKRCYVFPEEGMLFSWKKAPAGVGEEDVRKQWSVKRDKVGRERWNGDEERFWEGIDALVTDSSADAIPPWTSPYQFWGRVKFVSNKI
ncbi:hypothetical protein EV356DRAFT_509090 [Viridothelium virens]|uniref:Uncharacterized protein n=1 Tax=Viridothelium virens TaxID=1048519 RepID=A0A6A6GXS4_VIRVR|nr:hypothetical protein EV356DRAFT_509090 [Viridothelium virens]